MSLWLTALIIVTFISLTVSRHVIFGLIAYSIALFLAYKRFSFAEMGFINNFRTTLFPWLLTSFVMIAAVLILKQVYPSGIFNGFSKSYQVLLAHMPYYIFFSAVVQEIVFRGYFFRRARQTFTLPTTVIITIIIFAAFHLPYIVQLRSALFYFSIIAGTIWTVLYAKYPNIILAAASHSIVGAIALLLLQKF